MPNGRTNGPMEDAIRISFGEDLVTSVDVLVTTGYQTIGLRVQLNTFRYKK